MTNFSLIDIWLALSIKVGSSILWICFRQQGELISSRQLAKGYDINPINSTHCEVVSLLVKAQ